MPIEAASWYEPTPRDLAFFQGDVVDGIPVVLMPPASEGKWVILRPGASVTLEQAKAGNLPVVFKPHVEGDAKLMRPWENDEDLVLARATKKRVAILTQTCDIGHRKHIQVASVYSAEKFESTKLSSLRENKIIYWFPLPADPPGLPTECFIDLTHTTSVHKSYLAKANHVKRLSNYARRMFQNKIANFFARPFGFCVDDIVIEPGDYLCEYCVLTSASIHLKHMEAGGKFEPCPSCGENVMWLKYPSHRQT